MIPLKYAHLLEKMLRFRAFKWKDGKVLIFGMTGAFHLLYVDIFAQKIMERDAGKRKTMEFYYTLGRFQAIQGVKIVNKIFGYIKTIKDKKRLIELNIGQFAVLGVGSFKIKTLDFNKDLFIFSGKSAIAEEYKKFFGLQKESIDNYIRGGLAGLIESIIDKPVTCIEASCISQGKLFCNFIVKTNEKWDLKDKIFKEQFVESKDIIRELMPKLSP